MIERSLERRKEVFTLQARMHLEKLYDEDSRITEIAQVYT